MRPKLMPRTPFHLRARSVGTPSFFQAPIGDIEDVRSGMIVFAGAPIDQGIIMSKPGARFGPRAIREASTFSRSIWEANPDHTSIDIDTLEATRLRTPLDILDVGDFAVDPADIQESRKAVAVGVAEIVSRGGIPVVLGGDHYVAFPCVEGFARGLLARTGSAKIGYVHVDSHTDLRDRYGDIGGQHNHSSATRRIAESRLIDPGNMVWLGLNGGIFNPETFVFAKQNNLKTISAKAIRTQGIGEVVRQAMEVANAGTDVVYVSVDIDVCNSADASGTGSSVFTGLTAAEFLALLSEIGSYATVAAIDMCEVSPPLDPSGTTADLAVEGILALLRRHLFEKARLPELWPRNEGKQCNEQGDHSSQNNSK
jgi:arginase family enzyme